MEIRRKNKKNDIWLIMFSLFMMICGATSATLLFIIFVSGILHDIVGWVSFAICLIIALITIINNFFILKSTSQLRKKYINVNVFISLAQIISIVFDGFQFKYNQGLGFVGYLRIVNENGQSFFGYYFEKFKFEFTFTFYDSQFSLIGIDFVMLCVFIYFFLKSRAFDEKKQDG